MSDWRDVILTHTEMCDLIDQLRAERDRAVIDLRLAEQTIFETNERFRDAIRWLSKEGGISNYKGQLYQELCDYCGKGFIPLSECSAFVIACLDEEKQ